MSMTSGREIQCLPYADFFSSTEICDNYSIQPATQWFQSQVGPMFGFLKCYLFLSKILFNRPNMTTLAK